MKRNFFGQKRLTEPNRIRTARPSKPEPNFNSNWTEQNPNLNLWDTSPCSACVGICKEQSWCLSYAVAIASGVA